jgi:hypothetical protein
MKLKGSPNPRRRLQIIRDGISKAETNVKLPNNSPFNASSGSNKEYLNMKSRLKNAVMKNEQETKKIANV